MSKQSRALSNRPEGLSDKEKAEFQDRQLMERDLRKDYIRQYENLSYFDEDNDNSLVNMLPPFASTPLKAIPKELFERTENELYKEYGEPTDLDKLLRVSFWQEYDRAVRRGVTMSMPNVYYGICNDAHFKRNILGNSFKMLYMCLPMREIEVQMEALLHKGVDEMQAILEQPMLNDKGVFNAKLAEVKLRVFQELMLRRRGSTLNRTEAVTKNLHLHSQMPGEAEKAAAAAMANQAPESIDELNKRIEALEGVVTRDVLDVAATQVVEVEEEDT